MKRRTVRDRSADPGECAEFRASRAAAKSLGVVQDDSGGVMPGVTIVVRNLATDVSRETVTNERGQYEVTSLTAGPVSGRGRAARVQATLAGPDYRPGQPGDSRRPRRSSSERSSETITVVGDGLDRPDHDVHLGKVVEQKQILELPLSGRNFADLGLLTPGVTTRGQSTLGGDGSRSCMASGPTPTTFSSTAWPTCRSAATRCRLGRTSTRSRSSRSRRPTSRPSSGATPGRW